MKTMKSLLWIAVIVSVLLAGCTTAVKMETARSLSKEQVIVFGKVNVFVDGRHIKMTPSGFKSYLTIEFREVGSSTIMEYKVDETGYFFWALPPGDYEVLGVYGFSAEVGLFEMMVPLAQPVWIPFTVQPEAESMYLGDLTLRLNKKRPVVQMLKDNYSVSIKAFRKMYPDAHTDPLNKVTKLEPLNPGTYVKETYICSENWGEFCSFNNVGITPTSPDRLQDVVVESTEPTLQWNPSPIPDVKYDVAIYEAYDSNWRKINLDLMMGKERWRRGRLVRYVQGLTSPTFKLDVPLQPDTTYSWSVRLRRGDSVSTWSQVKNTLIHPFTFWYFTVEQWETWLNFTTPSK